MEEARLAFILMVIQGFDTEKQFGKVAGGIKSNGFMVDGVTFHCHKYSN